MGLWNLIPAAANIGQGLVSAATATKEKYLDKEQISSLEKRKGNLTKDIRTSRLAHRIGNQAAKQTGGELDRAKLSLEQAKNRGEITGGAYISQLAELEQSRMQELGDISDKAVTKQEQINREREDRIKAAEDRIAKLHDIARQRRDAARASGFSMAASGAASAAGTAAGYLSGDDDPSDKKLSGVSLENFTKSIRDAPNQQLLEYFELSGEE